MAMISSDLMLLHWVPFYVQSSHEQDAIWEQIWAWISELSGQSKRSKLEAKDITVTLVTSLNFTLKGIDKWLLEESIF